MNWRRVRHSRFIYSSATGFGSSALGLRRSVFLLTPTKILAYNQRLERHHLRLRTAIASWLFVRGVEVDRISLRPKWLVPWKKDRSIYPSNVREIAGRPLAARRRRIAIVSPYFPYPFSHGG